jgi:gliding motility-associated lipoprotein GldH
MQISKILSGFVCYFVLFLALSCNQVYREYDKESFSSMIWRDGQAVTFNPTITDTSKQYRVTIGLRHHYDVQMKTLKVRMTTTSPSGKESSKDLSLELVKSDDQRAGDCAGDMCDLETVALDLIRFDEQGEYKISIVQAEGAHSIPGILEVGLIIDQIDQ